MLAKIGIKNTDSTVATAIRTIIILIFSWLCYYKALQDGQASVVVPIDKLSILVTIVFSYFVLKEKLTKKSLLGLVIITAGTLILVI